MENVKQSKNLSGSIMNKKYFAKFLPVEGKIKDGDLIWNPKKPGQRPWNCQTPSNYDNPHVSYWDGHTKVKLFLCSRDIQVGDTIKIPAYGNTYITSVVYNTEDDVELIEENNCLIAKHTWCTIDGIPKDSFKVIGEISSEATWVKEGDEFDEKDLLLFEYPEGLDEKDFWVEWDWKNLNELLENVKLRSSVLIKVIK